MASVNGIKSYVNFFVQKAGASFVQRPQIVSVLKEDLKRVKPAIDRFEHTNIKRVLLVR